MLKQIVLTVLLLGAALGLWFERDTLLGYFAGSSPGGSENQPQAETPKGAPVIVAPVRWAQDDVTVEVVGTGRAQRTVTLRTEAEGKIVAMTLAAGRHYAKGEVLLRLDDADERLALALAESRHGEAKRVLDRFEQLHSKGTAATAKLDEVATLAKIAGIELEQAREFLADRTLRAPFDGVSGLPEVEVGDRVDNDDAIATFDDRSTLLVEFDLPEALQARVKDGAAVTASTPAHRDRSFDGWVSAINSRIEASTRTTRVRIAIPNEGDLLRPGASFTIGMELQGARYPLVPELALQFSRGSLHVWRIVEERAEKVPVKLIRRRAGQVLVEGPLEEGEPVVTEGTQRLIPGKPVHLVQPLEGGAGS